MLVPGGHVRWRERFTWRSATRRWRWFRGRPCRRLKLSRSAWDGGLSGCLRSGATSTSTISFLFEGRDGAGQGVLQLRDDGVSVRGTSRARACSIRMRGRDLPHLFHVCARARHSAHRHTTFSTSRRRDETKTGCPIPWRGFATMTGTAMGELLVPGRYRRLRRDLRANRHRPKQWCSLRAWRKRVQAGRVG